MTTSRTERSRRAIPSPRRTGLRGAFTLIELLLVIVIIGVLTAMIVPQFSAGLGGTRLQVEARAIVQAERYARTMALLHQAEVSLAIESGSKMRVDAAPQAAEDRSLNNGNDSDVPGGGFPFARLAPGPKAVTNLSAARDDQDGDASPLIALPAAVATADAFASAIRVEHAFDRVKVRFLGYTDSEGGLDAQSDGEESVQIRFRSNGTCRPHRFRLEDASGSSLEVQIDLLGSATIDAS